MLDVITRKGMQNATSKQSVTRRQAISTEITNLIKARNTLLWVSTMEEARAETTITEAAGAAKHTTVFWDCATGLTTINGSTPTWDTIRKEVRDQANAVSGDPAGLLDFIAEYGKNFAQVPAGKLEAQTVFVLRDLHKWFDPMILRRLRNLAKRLQQSFERLATIVVLAPTAEIPADLAGHVVMVDFPIPDRAEIAEILTNSIAGLGPLSAKVLAALGGSSGPRWDAAVDAAVGLTAEEATNCYARSIVTTKTIDPAIVTAEKKRVISKERVLTWYDPNPRGLDAVGGLENLKAWLTVRRSAFSSEARDFGLPAPKGVMLVGIPGCGKSLIAKCISAAWGMPLLRLDMGALRSKYVGESEQNIRKALTMAETVAPCVLWLDEIEKALEGAGGPAGDGGVSADALGAVLSWMQERKGSVFVIATANDVRRLPPEFLRKGRFDELFWIDTPSPTERKAILNTALAEHGRTADGIDLDEVVNATDTFTGVEVANIVPDGLFQAFNDGKRALTTADLIGAAKTVSPLSVTMRERFDELRKWAKDRTRPASRADEVQTGVPVPGPGNRALFIERTDD